MAVRHFCDFCKQEIRDPKNRSYSLRLYRNGLLVWMIEMCQNCSVQVRPAIDDRLERTANERSS